MSQQEFETYLALLSRLLRLQPDQREQVAEELRDHLETRLEELSSHGVPHAKAVQMALDEFGDVAGVANSFSSLVRERRRRFAMRATTISVGAVAALVLVSVAFWPEAQGPAPRRATAQVGPRRTAPPAAKPAEPVRAAATPARQQTELEQKLSERITVEFMETPLKDVFTFLSDASSVQFYVNEKALSEEGFTLDTPVTIRLKDVRLDTVLDLVLEQFGNTVAYMERDGVLIISEASRLADRLEVHVYNCRDLLALDVPGQRAGQAMMGMGAMPGSVGPAGAGAGMMGPMGSSAPPGMSSSMGGMGGMGGGMGAGGFNMVSGFGSQHDARAAHLMNLVTQIVKPDSWSEAGGPGSLAEYGGLLVVRQNPRVHREVEKLLAMLREQASSEQGVQPQHPALPVQRPLPVSPSAELELPPLKP